MFLGSRSSVVEHSLGKGEVMGSSPIESSRTREKTLNDPKKISTQDDFNRVARCHNHKTVITLIHATSWAYALIRLTKEIVKSI